MYSALYKIYFLKFKNQKIDSLYKRIIIRLLNILFPVLFTVNPFKSKLKGISERKPELIVSLTTFPVRVKKVWMVIETLLSQRTRPDKILLWLSEDECNGRESLPVNLLRLEKRGLEIRFCGENLMPHKKYLYTMLEYPEADVVTVDDDIFYPGDLLTKLVKYHLDYPDVIVSTVGRKMKIEGDKIFPYNEWEHHKNGSCPSLQILPVGAGGVYFPAGSLHPESLDKEKIRAHAPMNSDLWLKINSLRVGSRVVCINGEYSRFFIPVIFNKNRKLSEENVGKGRNDIVCRRLMELYNIPVEGLQD